MKYMLTALTAALIAVPAFAPVSALAQDAQKGKATFTGEDGKEIGTAELTGTKAGVLISIEINGLPADKWVAFHVHETGSCDAMTHYDSAGGHFNPTKAEHGYESGNGPHAGDMPNQYVPADGTLRAQVFNSAVTLGKGENGITGRALMIHANPDDYSSQPAGDAGKRLACAVIE
jgi:superoxide dismutase, Cu-Zn family